MKLTPCIPFSRSRAGMTLLELTVVILVLLSLIAILFIGARAWKQGSDRAACIMIVRNAQVAIRGYANTHGLQPGQGIPGGLSREDVISGPGKYLPTWPECPGGGAYGGQELTTIPTMGTVLMACNWGDPVDNHFPDHNSDW